MAAKLVEFGGVSFVAMCPRCRNRRSVSVSGLVAQYGGHHAISMVVHRLRFSTCRTIPAEVTLTNGHSAVMLVGLGSY